MKDKIFLDTNVLIYCYSSSEPDKQFKAQVVASATNATISTQVLKEFADTLSRKFKLSWKEIHQAIEELKNNFIVHTNTPTTIEDACLLADKYKYSFYDSLIIIAALESDCVVLYSEDMQDGQIIEKKLTIKNPFNT
ncbi:MAG: PIN domain-containing protein [Saprospiraceae bacterium]